MRRPSAAGAVGIWVLGPCGSAPAGHLEMGALAAAIGAPGGLLINGSLTLLSAAWLLVRAPDYRWRAATEAAHRVMTPWGRVFKPRFSSLRGGRLMNVRGQDDTSQQIADPESGLKTRPSTTATWVAEVVPALLAASVLQPGNDEVVAGLEPVLASESAGNSRPDRRTGTAVPRRCPPRRRRPPDGAAREAKKAVMRSSAVRPWAIPGPFVATVGASARRCRRPRQSRLVRRHRTWRHTPRRFLRARGVGDLPAVPEVEPRGPSPAPECGSPRGVMIAAFIAAASLLPCLVCGVVGRRTRAARRRCPPPAFHSLPPRLRDLAPAGPAHQPAPSDGRWAPGGRPVLPRAGGRSVATRAPARRSAAGVLTATGGSLTGCDGLARTAGAGAHAWCAAAGPVECGALAPGGPARADPRSARPSWRMAAPGTGGESLVLDSAAPRTGHDGLLQRDLDRPPAPGRGGPSRPLDRRREIIAIIREFRPDLVLSPSPAERPAQASSGRRATNARTTATGDRRRDAPASGAAARPIW